VVGQCTVEEIKNSGDIIFNQNHHIVCNSNVSRDGTILSQKRSLLCSMLSEEAGNKQWVNLEQAFTVSPRDKPRYEEKD
jgi:hypothetical protein